MHTLPPGDTAQATRYDLNLNAPLNQLQVIKVTKTVLFRYYDIPPLKSSSTQYQVRLGATSSRHHKSNLDRDHS